MKINEIIVESEELEEAGWRDVVSKINPLSQQNRTARADKQAAADYATLSKDSARRNQEVVKNWIYNWNRISAGMPEERLNSPEKYAAELTAFAQRALHNNAFTVGSAPAITFNGVPSKSTVTPQSVTAFMTAAVAQKDVPPPANSQQAQPAAPEQSPAQAATTARDNGPVPDPGHWIQIITPKEKHVYYKTDKGWITSDRQPVPSETSIKFLNDIADSSGRQILPKNQFNAKRR